MFAVLVSADKVYLFSHSPPYQEGYWRGVSGFMILQLLAGHFHYIVFGDFVYSEVEEFIFSTKQNYCEVRNITFSNVKLLILVFNILYYPAVSEARIVYM